MIIMKQHEATLYVFVFFKQKCFRCLVGWSLVGQLLGSRPGRASRGPPGTGAKPT